MKVQGETVPLRGHLSPLGQHTSPGSIPLIAFRVQLKQNLWVETEGHCTKSDPSRSPLQLRQLMSSPEGGAVVGAVVVVVSSVAGSGLTT